MTSLWIHCRYRCCKIPKIRYLGVVLVQVLTMQPSGKAAFEEVFMFSHQDAQQVSTFASLTTSSGKTISATPGHYLWVQKPSQEPQLTLAGDVKVGIQHAHGPSQQS